MVRVYSLYIVLWEVMVALLQYISLSTNVPAILWRFLQVSLRFCHFLYAGAAH